MQLAKVIGTVVATTKEQALNGLKILMIQPLTDELKPSGGPIAAIDVVQAGPGDVVLIEREGNTARQLLGTPEDPFHAVIVGIVDKVSTVV